MTTALTLFPEPGPTEIAEAQCPSDPLAVLSAVRSVLPYALVYRGGTYHIETCRDARVNSRLYGCSDKCLSVQSVFVWVNAMVERRPAEVRGARGRRGA